MYCPLGYINPIKLIALYLMCKFLQIINKISLAEGIVHHLLHAFSHLMDRAILQGLSRKVLQSWYPRVFAVNSSIGF